MPVSVEVVVEELAVSCRSLRAHHVALTLAPETNRVATLHGLTIRQIQRDRSIQVAVTEELRL